MIGHVVDNPLCWVMLLTAWFTYQSIFSLVSSTKKRSKPLQQDQETDGTELLPSVLIGALPLMGLLGTISGLQTSFTGMITGGVDSQLVTQGIADALFTTQLGLVLAIPGWLLLMMAKYRQTRSLVGVQKEVASG